MPRFIKYIQDTRREMAHVSWPTRAQTIAFTVMVVLICVIGAIYLSFFDAVFTSGLRYALDNAPRFHQVAPAVDVQMATTTVVGTTTPFTVDPIK